MKTNLAILIAGTVILMPTLAVAQPAPAPSGQASAKAQTTGTGQDSTASQKCAAAAKSADAKPEHDPSALPGKDTGWVPPPRKKPKTSAASGCDTQPQ